MLIATRTGATLGAGAITSCKVHQSQVGHRIPDEINLVIKAAATSPRTSASDCAMSPPAPSPSAAPMRKSVVIVMNGKSGSV